jgi:hypothetical protein
MTNKEKADFNAAAIKRAKEKMQAIRAALQQTPPEIKSLLDGLYKSGEKF